MTVVLRVVCVCVCVRAIERVMISVPDCLAEQAVVMMFDSTAPCIAIESNRVVPGFGFGVFRFLLLFRFVRAYISPNVTGNHASHDVGAGVSSSARNHLSQATSTGVVPSDPGVGKAHLSGFMYDDVARCNMLGRALLIISSTSPRPWPEAP